MKAICSPWIAVFLLSTQASASDDPISEADSVDDLRAGYDTRRWTQREGLPQSTVTGIVPGADGTLLISTFAGLARFDGQRATEVSTTGEFANVSQITRIRSQEGDPSETWVGTVGYGLWSYGETFSQPPQPPELLKSTIWDIDERDGNLLISSSEGGYLRKAGGEWSRIIDSVHKGLLGRDGTRWLCGFEREEGVQVQRPGEETIRIVLPDKEVCQSGLLDPDGDFWILGSNSMFLVDAQGGVSPVLGLVLQVGWGQSPLLDSSGNLWVGAVDGIMELGPWQQVKAAVKAGQMTMPRARAEGAPRAWHSSASGTLWIGTVGEGLVRLTPLEFAKLRERPRRFSRGSGPLHGDRNSVWYTQDCIDLHVRSADGSVNAVPLPAQVSENPLCIEALWAGDGRAFAVRGRKLLAGTAEGLEVVSARSPDEIDDLLISIEGRDDGGAWLGSEEGQLLEYSDGSMTLIEPQPPEGVGTILDILERRDGSLVLGHSEGLCALRANQWQCWSEEDGVAQGPVRHLHEDPEGRIWYASYGGGLGWLDEHGLGRVPTGDAGIPDRFLSAILDDHQGSLWLQGNAGVTRVRIEDLHRLENVQGVPLRTELVEVGESNGYLRNSAAFFNDTQVWVAGVDSISVVDTEAFPRSATPKAPLVLSAAVGDHELDLADARPDAPSNAFRRLEVDYASPNVEEVGVWFEHRLVHKGGQPPWMEAGDTRTAVYTGLTPGDYRFEVREVGLDGRKGVPAVLSFAVTPKWWEHVWLLPASLIAVFIGIGSIFSLRMREVGRRAEVLQAEIERRTDVERRLQEREARFRQVFDRSVNGFLLHDTQGRCLTANSAACALFGLERDALLATPRNELGLPEALTSLRSGPFLFTRANGERFAARIDEVRYDGGQGPRVLTSLVDLTALFTAQDQERKLRSQLASAQRLEAMGRLAGGIAHDMNNVLAAISSNVEVLDAIVSETHGPMHEEAKLCVSDAQEGVVRGSSMIQQLLTFSRKKLVETTAVDPDRVVHDLERMLHQLMPSDRDLEIVRAKVGWVRMNQTQLEQVILNLVLNASDAVGPGGHVRLTLSAGTSADQIQLAVEDDGPGIESDVLEHLFEPFYTTKEVGKGTGLGLSTAKSVVEGAGGSLTVETGALGSRFLVSLPTQHARPEPRVPQAKPAQGDGSLILLVDDDGGVRRSVKRQLVRAGWTVDDFEDPLEALQQLTEPGYAPELLITDVLMPGLNGRQLAQLAIQENPNLKVLFISGYTGDVLGDGSTDSHPILQKPFLQQELLFMVQELVNRPAQRHSFQDEIPQA